MSLLENILSGARGHELGRFETSDDQNPTGLGDAGKIRVHFGPGGDTSDGSLTVAPDGLITQNLGKPLRLDVQLSVGRDGPSGIARIMGRAMMALDGIEANAEQTGSTLSLEVDNANIIQEERITIFTQLPAGALLFFELARDEAGADGGGLITNLPTGTLAGWNDATTASLTIRTM